MPEPGPAAAPAPAPAAQPSPPIPAAELVGRMRQVPGQYRLFTDDEAAAVGTFKVPPDLLHELLDHGMPHRRSDDGRLLFDRLDVENVGLARRLPAPRYLAMRRWRRALSAPRESGHCEYRISIAARCPDPGHAGPCGFAVNPDVLAAVCAGRPVTLEDGTAAAGVSIPVPAGGYRAAHRELFRCVEPLDFHLVPIPMPIDLGWARETRLADCRIAARLLVTRAAEQGLAARPADGYVLLAPFPMRHWWIELGGEDEVWSVADPFLFQSLARWGIVDPAEVPIDTSPAGLLWKLHDFNPQVVLPLLTHGDRPTDHLFTVGRTQPAATGR